ncbi:MAG: hypothetical protein LBR82_09085 [Desulfovibrio sp.]|jgi:hypothetical protein|nr:hypothetical protein [Desulfovibrio sp.]
MTISIRFAGINDWNRTIFTANTANGYKVYKSVELMPSEDFDILSESEKEKLLRSLHTTDCFDGEPGHPVAREKFKLVVDY